jgi:phosphoglycerol transferase MdoB-like AlkP superfamily enzyme
MIVAPFLVLLVFSLYTLFTATDVLEFAGGMLRVSLSLLGVIAARDSSATLLPGAVLLFAVLSLALLATSRGEVQLDHDES